jgi:T5SS/PEP-CTERM-associated repeat protein/autotransporter-associated beta strand protein
MLALAMILYDAPNAVAVQTTWIGGEGANWSVDANWDNHVPTSTVDAYLANGNTAVIDQAGAACSYLALGQSQGTTGKLAVQSGTLATSIWVTVGNYGSGVLAITGGGQVDSTDGLVGSYSGATGTVTVDGANSKWTNSSGWLTVGGSGSGVLAISNGGQVSNTYQYVISMVGASSGSTGTVTVDGANSQWTNASVMNIGFSGSGALTITNGGSVSTGNSSGGSNVGCNSGSTGIVTVDGANSTWANLSTLTVGDNGAGTLIITNGGQVSSNGAEMGARSGSGSVTISGTNSKWTNSSYFYLGLNSTGTVTITDGGQLSTATVQVGYYSALPTTVTVDGANSKWNSSTLEVGIYGSGEVTIKNGGQVLSGSGWLGKVAGGTGTVMVDGANSQWRSSGSHRVGYDGSGTLNITRGGQVSNNSGYLGYHYGSGTVTVDGANSRWTNSSDLYVGRYGSGTLNVSGGGQVSNINGYVAYYSGATGMITVTDTGSTWISSNLYVGGSDTGAGGTGRLTVTNGGQVSILGILKLRKLDSLVTVNGGTVSAGTLAGTTGTIRISDPPAGVTLTIGSSTNDTFSGTIVDDTTPGSLKKIGSGTQTLGGNNTYSGATIISAGALQLSGSGKISAASAIEIASGAKYLVNVASGTKLKSRPIRSQMTGTALENLVASIIDDNNSLARTVSMEWRDRTADEINLVGLASNVLDLTLGTGAAPTFVLKMKYDPAATGDTMNLGWLDAGDQKWKLAVAGNIGGAPQRFLGPYDGNLTLGHYGLDPANHEVWAVVNHQSQFAVLPEPGTLAMVAGLGAAMLLAWGASKGVRVRGSGFRILDSRLNTIA